MHQIPAARPGARGTHGLAGVGLLVIVAVVLGLLVSLPAASPASSSHVVPAHEPGRAATGDHGVVDSEDGALPDGVTVFDDAHPGVANLDPDLLRALRDAATEAAGDGVEIRVNSGWRSHDYQDRLLAEAVARYGSEAEAARWVASADTSAHVSGDAVDLGPSAATGWLAEHGEAYGLCPIYRNEPWHFELRARAVERGCPRPYADATQDPRMAP